MTSFEPSEHDLHAYLDGQLDPAQARLVEAWLARHPETAAQVEGWRQDMQHLRAGLADLQGLPPNPALDPRAIRRARLARQRRQRRRRPPCCWPWGWGAWVAGRPVSRPCWRTSRPCRTPGGTPPVRPGQRRGGCAGRCRQPPGLAGPAFHPRVAHSRPVALRLAPGGWAAADQRAGAAAILLFEDANGQRVSLYLRSPGALYAEMPSGSRQDGDLEARYWSRNGYNYALVGPSGDPRGAVVQRALSL